MVTTKASNKSILFPKYTQRIVFQCIISKMNINKIMLSVNYNKVASIYNHCH